jgi:hypothetical protein
MVFAPAAPPESSVRKTARNLVAGSLAGCVEVRYAMGCGVIQTPLREHVRSNYISLATRAAQNMLSGV